MQTRRTPARSQLRTRFLLCLVAVGSVFGVLALRVAYLQLVEGARYRYLSENNRIRLERLPAPRGMVLDRRGEILADVRASFDALLIPSELEKEDREAVFAQLGARLGLEPDAVRLVAEGPGPARWKPRVLKRHLPRDEMAWLEGHRLEYPAVVVQATGVRAYPFGPQLGNALGYVGEISGRELRLPVYAEYESGDFIGRSGIEWAWEGVLRGGAGGQQVEVDVRGRKLNVLAGRPAHPGRNLVLTIDRRLQQAAQDAMGDEVGAVVALDIRNGDVLAMVSNPSYDPNQLAEGLSAEAWEAISSDDRHPLQNRAIQGVYPPGSTFKIAMALAGLAEGAITPSTQVYCSGEYQFAGRGYRCWKKTGHGAVNLEKALTESCDVYFYQLGLDIGVDAIHRWGREMGLGAASGIDLPGERSGLIPSKDWKRRARKEPWYAGETLSVAIGQGYVLATPLQLASMIGAVGHPQGIRMWPRLVARIEDAEGNAVEEIAPRQAATLPFRLGHLEMVRRGLRQVMSGERGTARKVDLPEYPLAGKTGTAQVVRMARGDAPATEEIPWKYRDHALFVCYAPYEDPRIAVAVVAEHGGHGGSTAAPIAARVVDAYRQLSLEAVSVIGVTR